VILTNRARTLIGFTRIALTVMLVGCSQPFATPQAPPAAAQPEVKVASAGLAVRMTDWIEPAPNLFEDVPLTDDLPTFAPGGDPAFIYPGPGLPLPQSKLQVRVDEQDVLARIAASIDQTGRPDVLPDLPAAFAGKLEGEHYVYRLGGIPRDGVYGPLVYMLSKGPDGWAATPICMRAWAWVWPGTQQQAKDPVVVCAYIEGSGAHLTLAAYKGDREVLHVQGLQDAYVEVIPAVDGGVPTIVTYGSHHWLDHKAEPGVFERYTYTWQNGAYALTGHERRADWVYHLARLIGFLAKGEPEKAAADFRAPPPGGVEALVGRNAPDLPRLAWGRWTTGGKFPQLPAGGSRAYLRPADSQNGPWFYFDFDEHGRIQVIGEQSDAPQ
jgi:hypothetical protein